MRLLNTRTLELESFIDPIGDAPPYAILSHFWEADEVLFEDMSTPERRRAAIAKKGWAKVRKSCEVALEEGFDYIWIDTLCIDKSSSAELSEAINSMFAWYAYSGICLAYLADFGRIADLVGDFGDLLVEDGLPNAKEAAAAVAVATRAFQDSRWFTRAWTLQELIAPAYLVFYDAQWRRVGDRGSLNDIISARASIYPSTIDRPVRQPTLNLVELKEHLRTVCIGVKMNWAAQRQATRHEDLAYSLLGIFDVNMSLLYGEGRQKAFLRLQEEIIKHGFDHSLLTWQKPSAAWKLPHIGRWDWVLAPEPELFIASRNLTHPRGQHRMDTGTLYPDGLQLDDVMVCPVKAIPPVLHDTHGGFVTNVFDDHQDSIERTSAGEFCAYLAILRCSVRGNFSKGIGILVVKDRARPDRYYRAHQSVFVVEAGDKFIALDDRNRIKLGIDLGKAEPQRIMLCSSPTVSWQTRSGSWPCAYNWVTEDPGWRLKGYLESRRTWDGILEPPLPSWFPDGSDVEIMGNFLVAGRCQLMGVMLFEQVGASALLVLWGLVPESPGRASGEGPFYELVGPQGPGEAPWWKSKGGYFCSVVDWEEFNYESSYRSADVDRLWRDNDEEDSRFNKLLLRMCNKLAVRSLKACVTTIIRQTRVEVSVGIQGFLGVDGVVVKVAIGREDSSVPLAELHKHVASPLKLR